jgi:D-threo-aldose 1-dehydrogenase
VGRPLIETAPIGTTGLDVSRVGFGGAPVGDLARCPDPAVARQILDAAWDAGIRYFDTAPMYGNGLSERRIGDFLRDKPREDYVLSSKVGRILVPDRPGAMERSGGNRSAMPFRYTFDYTYDGVMRSHEFSLQRLGLESIDILYIHDLGRFAQGERHDSTWEQATAGGGFRALQELRDKGVVKAIGAGVNEWEVLDQMMDLGKWDVFLLANRYTLLNQEVLDHFLPRCEKEGVAIVDGAALNTGILATGRVPGARYDYEPAPERILKRVDRIEEICGAHGLPMVAVAYSFPYGHSAIASVIPGFARLSDLTENLQHLRTPIPDELWADLREAGLLHPAAPIPRTPILAP